MPRDDMPNIQIPQKYKHDLKVMPCRVCGRPMKVGVRTQKKPRCVECGIDAMRTHNTELHQHQGKAFEAWKSAMRRFIDEETPATLPPETIPPIQSKE